METLRIGVATPPGMSAAYTYFAPAVVLGLDREEGLAFELFYGGTPDQTAAATAAVKCDLACLNAIVGLVARDDGIPLIAIGAKARRAHRWFAVKPEDSARSLKDLRGRRIACEYVHLRKLGEAALVSEGVSPKEIDWVEWMGSDMEAAGMIDAVRSGRVEAVFTIDWNDGDFAAHGLPLRRLPSLLLDGLKLSSCYWTSEENLARRRNVLGPALRALTRSILYAAAHPSETVEMAWQRFPECRPVGGDLEWSKARYISVLKACLAPMLVEPEDQDPRLGVIDPGDVAHTRDYLLRAGWIKGPIDPRDCFTQEFEQFFDVAAS